MTILNNTVWHGEMSPEEYLRGGKYGRESQPRSLGRVAKRIELAVLEYVSAHLHTEFHANELVAFVQQRFPVAPDSPMRILRMLAKRKVVMYRVIDRRNSLYYIEEVNHAD